jgi:Zn-finger nucleic acid-binding protein
MARNCPDCQEQLNLERFHGINLDVCISCAGLWFDPEELRRLITSDPLAVVALDDHIVREVKQGTGAASHPIHALHCPDCAMPLEAFHYEYSSPVQMNACPDCGGFWMLEQELLKLQHWLEQEKHALEDATVRERLQLAEIQMQHDEVMQRQEHVGRLMRLLQTRVPHWNPFLPVG